MFTLTLIRDRILAKLDAETAQNLNIELGELMTAAADEEFDAAGEAAGKLREIVAGVKPAVMPPLVCPTGHTGMSSERKTPPARIVFV